MPIKVNIYDFQCFNQLRNGASFNQNLSEFTPNLVGNVGEKVKVKYFADVEQYAAAEGSQEWNFIELVDDAEVEVDRGSGSFLDDRIQVGDKFQYYADWENRKDPSVNPGFNATVDFISSDGRIMRFTIDSFIAPITGFVPGSYSNVGFSFDQYNATNQNSAAYVRFGLLGNDETFNFNSKVTGSQQIYYVGEMTPAGTGYPAQSLGKIKDWVSGQLEVFFSTSSRDFDAGSYIIEHEFIITPFYLLAYRQFIENDTVPELLEGTNALKYAVELEFRKTLSNTGSSKKAIVDNLAGFVGWYGENFNGLNAKYRVKSIAYEEAVSGDPLDGININVATKATITVENPNAAITDYSCAAYIVRVTQAEEEFIGTQTDLIENFIYKSAIVASPATSATNITTSLNGGDLIIEFTIDYSTAEKLRLTTDDEFLLLVQVEDPTISAGNSDRTMLVADFKNYVDVDYLADFVNVADYGFLLHPQELGVDDLQNSPTVCNEDGILLDATFGVNTLRDVVVNSLRVALIAYNSVENKSFELDSYEFNFGGFVESGGVQQIEVDATRGYPLPANDVFNLVQVTTESLVSNYQQYRILLGQKIKWQEWILNSEVDPVFFQAGEPNNNLNFKSSNYSNLNGYVIKLALVVNVSGEDDLGRVISGDFINYGGDLTVQNYGVSSDGVAGTIETFDVETGQPLQGDILYNGKDTLFKTTFLNAGSIIYGIHRIEPSQNPGDGILELSSLLPSVSNNLLKPLPGETALKYTVIGSQVVTECLIDGSLIEENTSYKLSARAGQEPLSNPFIATFDTTQTEAGSSANDSLTLPFSTSSPVVIDWGDGSAFESITNPGAVTVSHTYAAAGVYSVSIYRSFSFRYEDLAANDRFKINTISEFGAFTFENIETFWGCDNLDITAVTAPPINTTDLSRTFADCTNLVYNSSIDNYDLSNVQILSSMFLNCSGFNQNLSSWDVSTVTDLSNTFRGCSIFTGAGLDGWNVSPLSLTGTFFGCTNFDQNLSGWDVSAVTSVERCFMLCTSFNNPLNWSLPSLNGNQRSFLNGASSFNQDLVNLLPSGNNATNILGFLQNCTAFNGDVSGWDLANATLTQECFNGCINFTGVGLDTWAISVAGSMRRMFGNCTSLPSVNLSSWDMSGVTSINQMFIDCPNFNGNIDSWDVSNVTDFSAVFQRCFVFNRNLSAWDVSSGVDFTGMFFDATSFNNALTGWVINGVMDSMFRNATSFNGQSLDSWDVTGVTSAVSFALGTTSITTPNYDSLLIAWEGQAVNNNISIDFGNARYTAGGAAETARTNLINDHSWTITDGGPV